MHIEIVSDPLEPDDLWNDLTANIQLLQTLNIPEVLLLFGFSWGKYIYQDQWQEIPTPTGSIAESIRRFEEVRYGQLSRDNLYLTVPEWQARVQYSYESDIHLSYEKTNPFVDSVMERWTSQRWLLVHWSDRRQKSTRKKT
jgi:hypothetical protein